MTDSNQTLILRYHEVALKGGNRGWFEDRLASNAKKLIEKELQIDGQPTPTIKVIRQYGRILIEIPSDVSDQNAIRVALGRLFGISSYSPIRKAQTDRNILIQSALEETQAYIQKHGMPRTFRVITRRTEKALPETSTEIDRFIGSAVQSAYPQIAVDLENAEFILGIEVRYGQSFLWNEKIHGAGGLPVGCNGRVLSLISGGIDSPVAAIQTLRRGSPCSFLHFYGTPFVGEDVLEKVEDLVRLVNQFQPEHQPLYIVPFGKLQEKIALVTNPKMRTIIYRRMMIRIACRVAHLIKAQALITGESLGQVASQTIENLGTINVVADIPILRPLITYDKDEIIEQAKKRGTYETSIRPGLDCCTLFADRHPSIRTTLAILEEEETKFPVQEMIEEALANATISKR